MFLRHLKNSNLETQYRANRAAGFILAALFSFSAFAQTAQKETWQDIIQKAYNLSLQKDRKHALTILHAAIKREPNQGIAASKLKQTVSEISTVFLMDKAQQAFEISMSMKPTDPAQALVKISDAYKLEPDNSIIVAELSRQLMSKGDCAAAVDTLKKYRQINPYIEDVQLALLQGYMCNYDLVSYATAKSASEFKSPTTSIGWMNLELERAAREKNSSKAKEVFDRIVSVDSNYPESYYVMWKIEGSGSKVKLKCAKKYSALCQKADTRLFGKYSFEPNLCRRALEVESWLNSEGIKNE